MSRIPCLRNAGREIVDSLVLSPKSTNSPPMTPGFTFQISAHPMLRTLAAMPTYPVGHLERLALGSLSALQRLLDSAQRLGVEGLGRGHDDLELTPVGSDQRVKVGKNPLGGAESTVLGEDIEEVEQDGGRALRKERVEGFRSVRGGECGVFYWSKSCVEDTERIDSV